MMRTIDTVIVHCADTPESMDIGYKEIYKWHVEENGWDDVGYHYIIRRDGIVERGRGESVAGAHCRGKNQSSIGICLVGRNRFTREQFHSLRQLVDDIEARYSIKEVTGHYKYSDKTCPNINVEEWYKEYER